MKHPVYLFMQDYWWNTLYICLGKDNDETLCISAYARIMMKHPVYLFMQEKWWNTLYICLGKDNPAFHPALKVAWSEPVQHILYCI